MMALLFSLLFTVGASAATNTGIPQSLFGGGGIANVLPSVVVEESNPQGYFMVHGASQGGAAAFVPLYRDGGRYRVRTGFYADCRNVTYTGAAANLFQLVSATSPIGQGVGAIVGGVYQMGAAANYWFPVLTLNVYQSIPITYSVSSDYYFGYQQNSNSTYYISVLCKEKAL